ncbi:dihydrofolate reductase [Arthrobacter sp. AQ5-05]|uniref:dihydrofolate reductase family protein n=1 Tax=Arthrobacter sp. AQ5-05 TaxID=2184581 RepID=UPI000DCB9AF5|nr:dihydrofolate reductase family protein [Arthrobacter sp. AQ5-05]RAX49452.1 dihydrofolate reductase [Arthrobacter sp. AQ5-05]
MRRLTVMNNLSLDGVMQAPGRPDEDTRNGFERGGWAVKYNDAVLGEFLGRGLGVEAELVLGRRTYEDLAAYWPNQGDNPYTERLNKLTKHVASRTLKAPLSWQNSVLLPGEAVSAVAGLKQESGPDLLVMGSGNLLRSLIGAGLVDEYTLLIHPLVLGRGTRLFGDGLPNAELDLVESLATTTGVIIAVYRPVL